MSNSARRLVSLAEAAEHYDVSTLTMRRHVKAGRIPGYRIGRLLKVDLVEADAVLLRPVVDRDALVARAVADLDDLTDAQRERVAALLTSAVSR